MRYDFSVLHGIAELATQKHKEPEHIQANHQHRKDAEGSVEASRAYNTRDIQKREGVIETE